MSDPTSVETTPVVAEQPPSRSTRWLDLPRLRADIRVLGNLAFGLKASRAQHQRDHDFDLAPADDRRLASLKARLTELCALRALHRQKRHVHRYRVFGPGHPNGTAIVTGPAHVSADLIQRYLAKPQ